MEFLKSIRLPEEEKMKKNGRTQGTQNNQTHKMTRQEEFDLQKELERRFDELFGSASDEE